MNEQDYTAWCQNFFNMIAEGGIWGVPRSGLIFTKKGDTLVLTDMAPDMENPGWRDYQEDDYRTIKNEFWKAGITVTREL